MAYFLPALVDTHMPANKVIGDMLMGAVLGLVCGQLVVIVLKFADYLPLPWWFILSPSWAPLALLVVMCAMDKVIDCAFTFIRR